MLKPITAQQIIDTWAKAPLDFEPGAKYQYSNTNYVIAGRIVEMVSGKPFVTFLRENILSPLKMETAFITDDGALPAGDANRYFRYALGPKRIAPKEGKGWLFAAGELAMTASDLAKWDIAMINQKVLKPASYREQQRATILTDGRASNYALGITVGTFSGHRELSHGGAVSGFTAQNSVFPDDRAAIVVFTNFDAGDPGSIEQSIARILFTGPNDPATERAIAQVKTMLADLQTGKIDRNLLTQNASDYFSAEALAVFASSLQKLGACTEVNQAATNLRGGMTFRAFRVTCGKTPIVVTTRTMSNGKLEQFLVEPG
jgi:CubicO group peptidase (beta-lactamase class C family)